MPIQPKPLKKGDTIAIVCPASKLDREVIVEAAKIIETWGLQVLIGDSVGASYHTFAGDDQLRISDFQHYLDDPKVRAILCARGGYGAARIIDYISFENFVQDPIWIVGYSDVTTFHNHINEVFGIETIHSVMPSGFASSKPEAEISLRETLFGTAFTYQFGYHEQNRLGQATGKLVGGNLSIVHSLLGSISQLNTDGKILFLEDVGERLYNIDRMVVSLKRAGLLTNLAGICLGSFTDSTGENFGKTPEQIVREHCEGYAYPIACGFPAGHQPDNRALLFNREVELKVHAEHSLLRFFPS